MDNHVGDNVFFLPKYLTTLVFFEQFLINQYERKSKQINVTGALVVIIENTKDSVEHQL